MSQYHYEVKRQDPATHEMAKVGTVEKVPDYKLFDLVEHKFGKGRYNLVLVDIWGNVVKKIDGQEVPSIISLIIED